MGRGACSTPHQICIAGMILWNSADVWMGLLSRSWFTTFVSDVSVSKRYINGYQSYIHTMYIQTGKWWSIACTWLKPWKGLPWFACADRGSLDEVGIFWAQVATELHQWALPSNADAGRIGRGEGKPNCTRYSLQANNFGGHPFFLRSRSHPAIAQVLLVKGHSACSKP